jgi:hypothetical protein
VYIPYVIEVIRYIQWKYANCGAMTQKSWGVFVSVRESECVNE